MAILFLVFQRTIVLFFTAAPPFKILSNSVQGFQFLHSLVSARSLVVFNSLWPPAARQAPLSMGFSRPEYWSGLPCPSPGDLPNSGVEPMSLLSLLNWQVGSLPLAPPRKPSTASSTLVIFCICLFCNSHPNGYEEVSHDFYLHLPNNYAVEYLFLCLLAICISP